MKQSISSTFLYNIIITFIIIVFAVLAATVSYFKAFKVNSRIIHSLERFEGYNYLSKAEIEQTLETIAYRVRDDNQKECRAKTKDGGILQLGERFQKEASPEVYDYCIYLYMNDVPSNYQGKNTYYSYEVVTYINFDFPIINRFKVPIRSRSTRIFKFNDRQTGQLESGTWENR